MIHVLIRALKEATAKGVMWLSFKTATGEMELQSKFINVKKRKTA